MILEIPRIPESPNELRRFHWRHRHRHDKMWKEEVYWASLPHRPDSPLAKAHITIDRRSWGRLDPDNLTSSMKPVVDALRYARVIENDTEDHIKLDVTQSRGAPLTRIEIQPV
jgi:hypothetical protein